ncbi:hypothetical protein PHSC3_000268 [Chlamydiales bacterium STE3]|nr:hypothetical protein PHSC3_000268 [Chlamydiales bacterium STE3]
MFNFPRTTSPQATPSTGSESVFSRFKKNAAFVFSVFDPLFSSNPYVPKIAAQPSVSTRIAQSFSQATSSIPSQDQAPEPTTSKKTKKTSKPKLIYEWNMLATGRKIVLMQKGNSLSYELYDICMARKISENKLNFKNDGLTKKERLERFPKCIPILGKKGKIKFFPRITCQKIRFEKYKINLILLEELNLLFWQILNKKNESYCYHFNIATHLEDYHNYTLKMVHDKDIDPKIIMTILSQRTMDLEFTGSTINPFQVQLNELKLAPRIYNSAIDPRVRFSRTAWLVSLVTHKGSTKAPKNDGLKKGAGLLFKMCNDNHAQILVEGINEQGKPFLKILELLGDRQVKIREIDGSMFDFEKRSPIWKVSMLAAQKLIDAVEEDIKTPPEFHILGKNALLSKLSNGGHNCFTWAREKLLLIDVHLPTKKLESVSAATKLFTKKSIEYKKLIESCEDPISI